MMKRDQAGCNAVFQDKIWRDYIKREWESAIDWPKRSEERSKHKRHVLKAASMSPKIMNLNESVSLSWRPLNPGALSIKCILDPLAWA